MLLVDSVGQAYRLIFHKVSLHKYMVATFFFGAFFNCEHFSPHPFSHEFAVFYLALFHPIWPIWLDARTFCIDFARNNIVRCLLQLNKQASVNNHDSLLEF